MEIPRQVYAVVVIIVISFMIPVMALAQLGTGVTVMFDSDSVGAKSNGFISGDDPDAVFHDTVGENLEIVEYPFGAPITNKMLKVGGADSSSVEAIFSHPLADFSLQFSCDVNSEPDCLSLNATATLKVFENASDLIEAQTVQVIITGDDHQTIDACIGDCLTLFPNGFEKIQFQFSSDTTTNLTEYVDNFFGNALGDNLPIGCDSLQGAAYGLCIAYCEAMDCDSDYPRASETACERVMGNYQRALGDDSFPPCSQ